MYMEGCNDEKTIALVEKMIGLSGQLTTQE